MHNSILASQRLRALTAFGLLFWTHAVAHAQSATLATPSVTAKSSAAVHDRNDDDRINQLIRKMTLAEKIGQLQQSNTVDLEPPAKTGQQPSQENLVASIRQGEVGSILNEVDPAKINRLQKVAVEES